MLEYTCTCTPPTYSLPPSPMPSTIPRPPPDEAHLYPTEPMVQKLSLPPKEKDSFCSIRLIDSSSTLNAAPCDSTEPANRHWCEKKNVLNLMKPFPSLFDKGQVGTGRLKSSLMRKKECVTETPSYIRFGTTHTQNQERNAGKSYRTSHISKRNRLK